ncbi:MAG: aminotransferase class V-fold PLP-dependent enzyme [Candidatus Sumerlaeia bacterium]|nr:aminotransferase class V-fold PLP-dependent enzyme [Candidatus Sumerlaeia bacterium]
MTASPRMLVVDDEPVVCESCTRIFSSQGFAVETARDDVAALIGTRARDVVFCGSGTEALNWVIYAACGLTPKSRRAWGRRLIVSAVEHTAVLDAARCATEKAGLVLDVIGVDACGRVLPFDVPENTALVALQHVNHETGVLQPVDAVRERCARAGTRLLVDACQSVGVPIPAADAVVVSAHKRGGPGGVGVLGLARRFRLDPLLVGGEQELLRRAGGENVAGICAFGAAARTEVPDTTPLRDRLARGLLEIDGVEVVGIAADRAPHIVCATVAGIKGEALLMGMDRYGIACNSGSSCSAERLEPSHVLLAMGAEADSSLRFSFGWTSTQADVDAVLDRLPRLVRDLRSYSARA